MPAPNPYTDGEKSKSLFMVSAANPTFTRSMKFMKYSSTMNGISRHAHLAKICCSLMR